MEKELKQDYQESAKSRPGFCFLDIYKTKDLEDIFNSVT